MSQGPTGVGVPPEPASPPAPALPPRFPGGPDAPPQPARAPPSATVKSRAYLKLAMTLRRIASAGEVGEDRSQGRPLPREDRSQVDFRAGSSPRLARIVSGLAWRTRRVTT